MAKLGALCGTVCLELKASLQWFASCDFGGDLIGIAFTCSQAPDKTMCCFGLKGNGSAKRCLSEQAALGNSTGS